MCAYYSNIVVSVLLSTSKVSSSSVLLPASHQSVSQSQLETLIGSKRAEDDTELAIDCGVLIASNCREGELHRSIFASEWPLINKSILLHIED